MFFKKKNPSSAPRKALHLVVDKKISISNEIERRRTEKESLSEGEKVSEEGVDETSGPSNNNR